MTIQGPIGAPPPAPDAEAREKLHKITREFQGLFLKQMFAAMRSGVPQGGLIESSPGEEIWNSMMDDRLAEEAAARMERGLGEALYRQLCRRLEDAGSTTESTES